MINICDKSPDYRMSFRAADFYSLLSAYDETVSRNLGISQGSQDDVKRVSAFQGKGKSPRKNKDEAFFSKEVNCSEYCKLKTLQPLLMNTGVNEYPKSNHIILNDLSQQNRKGFSYSLPQALEKINSDMFSPKLWADLQSTSNSSVNENLPKVLNKHQLMNLENVQNTKGPLILVRQVDAKAETMAIGLPNCRALPTVHKTPKIIRARVFFNQVKAGLKEHIEWHTTQLQQAELDQDTVSANKASESVNQLQHRLDTIRCLEHEYLKHWKLFKEIKSRSQNELCSELAISGNNGGVKFEKECAHLSQLSTPTNSSSLLFKSKLSKSTLALTGFDGSDYTQLSSVLPNTTSHYEHHSCNNNTNDNAYNTTNYLPIITEKRPKYSSLLNLLRHKSKKSTNNYSAQSDNRPRAATITAPAITTTAQLSKQSNTDLATHIPLQKSETIYSSCNNSNVYSRGLSKSKSNARDFLTNNANFKQQQEVLLKRLCQIEAQTEYLSGTLICEVIGISGSVSSLSKDVFRISLKYDRPVLSSVCELQNDGKLPNIKPLYASTIPLYQKVGSNDKWTITSRLSSSSPPFSPSLSVLASNPSKSLAHLQTTYLNDVNIKFPEQKWDQTKHIFSPTIGDVLTIKVVVMRRFGKPELLVQQACDILNLLTFKGHHISIGLKSFTDLQFHFILKWCPLADTKDDRMLFYNLSSIQLGNFLDEQKQKSSSIKLLLKDAELNYFPSPKFDNSKQYRTHEQQQHPQHQHYHHQEHFTNLMKTEACSSEFIISQDDSDSSDLENKESVTILTVRSKRTPSKYDKSNKCHSKLSKWISLPDLEITHELSEPELISPEIKVITVRTHQGDENKKSHQINYVNTLDTSVNNTTCTHCTYNENTDNHADNSEARIVETKVEQQNLLEQPPHDNDIISVRVNALQTIKPRVSITKPTDNQLFYNLNKLKKMVDAKTRMHDDPSGLLKNLDKALRNLVIQLERNTYWFNRLFVPEQPQYDESVGPQPLKALEKNTDEQNTLKSLWESLAFLDEPEKSFDDFADDGTTSSVSGSAHSVRVIEKSDTYIFERDQTIKTTGWKQLDIALIWHLNYTIRLLDRVYPDHLYINRPIQSSISDASDKTMSTYACAGSLRSVRDSVHSAWSALPLFEQVEFFTELESLCQEIIHDPQTAECNFLLKVVGDGRPYSTLRFTCFLSKLIWPAKSTNNLPLSEDASSPQIIFDRDAFREILLRFYEKDVVPRWSKDMGNGVIDHFIEDVMDLEVNGSELSTVPLTHLNLRLKLSERMESITLSHRFTDQQSRDQLKQFNVYFIQLLSYLAGQLYIQWNLENIYSSRTLSTLPYFTRSLQPIFGLNILLSDIGVDLNHLEHVQNGLDMRSTELAACHSTQTWLRVAELIGNNDEEINKKAIMILKSMDDRIFKVFHHLINSKQNLQLSDVSHYQSVQMNSRNIVRRPIFYLMGPPIHIQYCLNKNCIKQNLNSLSPIWISMIWGLEQKSNIRRIAALKALTVLIEAHIRETAKAIQHNNTCKRNSGQNGNTTDGITNPTLLHLLSNLHSNDPDPVVKRLAGQIIDRISNRFITESHNEQVSHLTLPLIISYSYHMKYETNYY
ncbi:thymidylate synthase [Schistosoma japonicum]|nr:thymidylate synthase [Schistosoma japonicum]